MRWVLALILVLFTPLATLAEGRYALVIGNEHHAILPSAENAAADAQLVADELEQIGFDVMHLENARRREMLRAFQDIAHRAGPDPDAVILVFFAGHAMPVEGKNILLPSDFAGHASDPNSLVAEGIILGRVIEGLERASAATNLVILNAGYIDPVLSMTGSSVMPGHGLNPSRPTERTAIMLAAGPGGQAVAYDGASGTGASLFTEALVSELQTPGLTLDVVMARTRDSIVRQTQARGGAQRPYLSSGLSRDVVLNRGNTRPQTASPTPAPSPEPSAEPNSGSQDAELAFFRIAMDSGSPEYFEAYLARYPNGVFAPLAQMRLNELQSNAVAAPAQPTAVPQPSAPAQPAAPSSGALGGGGTPVPTSTEPSNDSAGGGVKATSGVLLGVAEPQPEPAPEPASEPRPSFPWPPPQPSSTVSLPLDQLPGGSEVRDFDSVMSMIEDALDGEGYHDRSYWTVPGGAALATRLERIQKTGEPADAQTRWPTDALEASFDLGGYIRSLFFTEPGYFRVIVFVLSTELVQTAEREPTSDEALDWLRRGMVELPADIGQEAVTSAHRLSALIYEFEKRGDSEAIVLSPGRLTGRDHLARAGLLDDLVSN